MASFSDRPCIRFTKFDAGSFGSLNSFNSCDNEFDCDDLMTEFVPEKERLDRLQEIQPAFENEGEEPYASVVKLVQSIFRVPIVLVSLVYDDFQWFKAGVGLKVNQTGRCVSFCAHTFEPKHPEVLYVPDAFEDSRFCDNPLVRGSPYIRFYCGVPLVTQDHVRLGSFCIIDDSPRSLQPKGMQMLINIAELTIRELLKSELGRKAYMDRMMSTPRPQILKLPSLERARAIRELWFERGLVEGVLVVDASASSWPVIWSNSCWTKIANRELLQHTSLWNMISPTKGDRHKTPECILNQLNSGKSHVSILAKLRAHKDPQEEAGDKDPQEKDDVDEDPIFVALKMCLAHQTVAIATCLIHLSDAPVPKSAQPITMKEGPLLVIRANKNDDVCLDRDCSSSLGLTPSSKESSIINAFCSIDADGTGKISATDFFAVMNKLAPGTGPQQGQIILDACGFEYDGQVQYKDFVKWVIGVSEPDVDGL